VTAAIEPLGPFSLDAAAEFLARFPPLAHPGYSPDGAIRLAFPADGYAGVAAVAVRERRGTIGVEQTGDADPGRVVAQTARILSLDHDGRLFAEVAAADEVVGVLASRMPGLRPVLFPSPYEAAAWCVLSQRLPTARAAAVRRRLAEGHGPRLAVAGAEAVAFPAPDELLRLESVPGLSAEKVRRLRGVAEAALDGRLDAGALRDAPADEAVARLKTIRGIGDFAAGLILARASGAADNLPQLEPRVRAAAAAAYGADTTGDDHWIALAERWRPFRTWVCFLLRQIA
jgi:DNA-3-methyladenine glycosylase II